MNLGVGGGRDGGVDVGRLGLGGMAQHLGPVERIGHGLCLDPGAQLAADDRTGGQRLAIDKLQRPGVGLAVGGLGIIAAEGVLTIAVHVFRNRNLGVTVGRLLDQGDGIGRDGRGGHALVQQGVDE